MTMGLNPYRGPAPYAPAPLAAAAIPGIPGIAATGSSVAAVHPEPASGAVEEANDAGVAADQPAGTDRPPTADASPMLAEAAAPKPPAGITEPTMVPSAMPAAPAAGVTESARAKGIDPT